MIDRYNDIKSFIDRQIERQTDRKIDIQKDKKDRQIERQKEGQIERQIDIQKDSLMYRKIYRYFLDRYVICNLILNLYNIT